MTKPRKCESCGLDTPIKVEGPYGTVEVDACFGDMLGEVINACCGHGDPRRAYVRIARVHSNGCDGCVDICGGEVIGYGEHLDHSLDERYAEADPTDAEAAEFARYVAGGGSPSVALSRLLHFRA